LIQLYVIPGLEYSGICWLWVQELTSHEDTSWSDDAAGGAAVAGRHLPSSTVRGRRGWRSVLDDLKEKISLSFKILNELHSWFSELLISSWTEDVRIVLWWIRRVTIEAENVGKSIIKFGEWMGIWRFVWITFGCHCWRNQWGKIFLLLRSVVAPWNANIQIFGAGWREEEMLTARGEGKKEPETCRLLLISRERESRVSVLRLFFFFSSSRRVAGGDLVFLLMSAFFGGVGRGLLSRSLSFHERLPAHRNVFK
jgi:hypothetical protein